MSEQKANQALYVPMGPTTHPEKAMFLRDLTAAAHLYSPIAKLIDVLDKGKGVKVVIWQPVVAEDSPTPFHENIRVAHFISHIDSFSQKYGRDFGFLRGFPVFWRPGVELRFKGFRVKFANDDCQGEIPVKADGAGWFQKLSGYLSQPITWIADDGTPCYTVSSKNSCDSTSEINDKSNNGFARDAARIWGEERINETYHGGTIVRVSNPPIITSDLIRKLEAEGAHFGAETMSFNDICHGAEVLEECPIVTSMSKGVVVNLVSSTVQNAPPSGSGFVTHCGFRDTIRFCVSNHVPVLDAVLVTGEAVSECLRELQTHRDHMPCVQYDSIILDVSRRFPGQVEILKGNRDHQKVLKDILEGIVVHWVVGEGTHSQLVDRIESGTADIFKYKFPDYTCRTMAVRTALSKNLHTLADVNTETFITQWADRWTLTAEGKQYWIEFVWAMMKKAQVGDMNPESPIGWHIRLADEVRKEWGESETHREEVRAFRKGVLAAAPPQLIGLSTLVAPGYDLKEIETILVAAKIASTSGKKKPKGVLGFVQITSSPPHLDRVEGDVYLLDGGKTIPDWMVPKLEDMRTNESVVMVESTTKLVDTIHQTIRDREAVEEEISPMEERMQAEITHLSASIREQIQEADKLRDTPDFCPLVFMPVGPQCGGKSTLYNSIKRCGGREVVLGSSDHHMALKTGGKFNWRLLKETHGLAQNDIYQGLRQKQHCFVDNTNIAADERTIYHDICHRTGGKLVKIPLFPELWLSECDRTEFVKTLVKRAVRREQTTGKSIGDAEKTITRTIDKARGDFKARVGGSYTPETLQEWLGLHPERKTTHGFVIESDVLMYRSPNIDEQSKPANYWSSLSPRPGVGVGFFRDVLLEKWMRRGKENHLTILDPREMGSLSPENRTSVTGPAETLKEFVGAEDGYSEPVIKGVGKAEGTGGDKVYYLVVEWDWAQQLRAKLGLGRKDFHVTLFWTGKNDIHGVPKGIETLIK